VIIDAHQHVFWHGRNDAGLVADMDEQGIDYAWLLGWEVAPDEDVDAYHGTLNPEHARPDGTHPGIVLSDIIKARDRYPDRFVLGYCPHPIMSDAPALFEAAYHIHGVRVCGEWKCITLIDDPRCIELFRKAGDLGCPVTFHLDPAYLPDKETGAIKYQRVWYGGTVANLERAMQACPGTTFVGHAPGFWREISGDADTSPGSYPTGPVTPGGRLEKLLAAYPNLHADLSAGSALRAIKRSPEYTVELFERFPDRFLFARDYFGGELRAFLETLNLEAGIREAIYHGNAERLVTPPGAATSTAATATLG
jgi:predicted TIM-barrel fold metal-dependent hydrolase